MLDTTEKRIGRVLVFRTPDDEEAIQEIIDKLHQILDAIDTKLDALDARVTALEP